MHTLYNTTSLHTSYFILFAVFFAVLCMHVSLSKKLLPNVVFPASIHKCQKRLKPIAYSWLWNLDWIIPYSGNIWQTWRIVHALPNLINGIRMAKIYPFAKLFHQTLLIRQTLTQPNVPDIRYYCLYWHVFYWL